MIVIPPGLLLCKTVRCHASQVGPSPLLPLLLFCLIWNMHAFNVQCTNSLNIMLGEEESFFSEIHFKHASALVSEHNMKEHCFSCLDIWLFQGCCKPEIMPLHHCEKNKATETKQVCSAMTWERLFFCFFLTVSWHTFLTFAVFAGIQFKC